jgi:CubicO group peptidase (beta-lactamase class C family)
MSKNSKRSRLRKILRGFGWTILAIFLSLNLFIVLSGRFYLYKGVYYTYLSGETSPTIYDKDKFYSSELPASTKPEPWKIHPKRHTLRLPDEYRAYVESYETQSLLVFKADTLIYEEYWNSHGPETVSNSFSAAKTVVSMLVGIATDEGYIKSIDEPVCHYLPEFSGKGKEKITIRHLLMMASGLNWGESGSDPLSENAESYYGWDLHGLVTRQKVARKPGELFLYQSGNTQLLGYVVEKATGKDLTDYADEKLWQPLGAEHPAFWSLDSKNGDEKSFCCLYSTSRDFARIGMLLSHNGNWKGRQLIPEWYFKEMVTPQKMATEEHIPNTRYGLHVWTFSGYGEPVYYCRGIKGQYIIALPQRDLVVVRTGHKRAPNFLIPGSEYRNPAYRAKFDSYVGHPTDLFKYINLAKLLEAQLRFD